MLKSADALKAPKQKMHGWKQMRSRASALIAAAALACFSQCFAQDYPNRRVTIIVPQAAGGGTDIISRIIANKLSSQLGQPFVVENRPGAGTVIGTALAAKAAPDGYTLLTGLNANMAVSPSLYTNLPYHPVRDFTPVGMLAELPFVLDVSNSFPAHSVKELIALAKAKPGEINYATAGNGSGAHQATALLELMTGIKMTHVPYRGAVDAYVDVVPGRTPVFLDNLAGALGQIRGGNLRVLAVTSKERSPVLPDVPTIAEAGVPGYNYTVWFGLWAPKNTPKPIVEKLYAEVQKALADPEVKRQINAQSGVPMHMPLADIEPFIKSEIAKWADVIARAGIRVE